MSIKPKIELSDAISLLKKLKFDVKEINEMSTGQIAKTFEFNVDDKNYFIQFNQENMSQGTINEIIFADEFKRNAIPLRNIKNQGEYFDYRYVITEKVTGKPFDKLTEDEFVELIPEVIKMLKKISETNISKFSNFGWLDENGNGKFESWETHLKFVREEEPGWFYENWHELFDSTFLEKDKFDFYYEKMIEFILYLPKERKLIHSGYCGGNIIIEDGKITAILDWQDARYGDSVFDLAYMIFWMNKSTAQKCISEYINEFKIDPDQNNLLERIKCYKYYIGLDCLRFAAKTNNNDFYNYISGLLLEI